jgi:hypothetical protein
MPADPVDLDALERTIMRALDPDDAVASDRMLLACARAAPALIAELRQARREVEEMRAVLAPALHAPDEDEHECHRCHKTMDVPGGMEPTAVCHACAQEIIEQIAALARKDGER